MDEPGDLDYQLIHTHQVVKSVLKRGDEVLHGVGTFESLVFARHARSGFEDLLAGVE